VTVHLDQPLAAAMLAHARETPAVEVCGLLGGAGGRLRSVYRVANIAPDPAQAFLMEPRGQIAAMKAMRTAGQILAGIYHSHPRGPAEPSAADLEQAAYPGVAYFIVAPAADPPLRLFAFDGRHFAPRALIIGA